VTGADKSKGLAKKCLKERKPNRGCSWGRAPTLGKQRGRYWVHQGPSGKAHHGLRNIGHMAKKSNEKKVRKRERKKGRFY